MKRMKKSTKIILIVGIVVLVILGVIGVTYAFFSTGGSQETANTFTSGCLSISLTDESDSINLTNAYPVTDVEGLEGTSYDFTITNNCDSSTNYQINLESLNQVANSLNADYIKVALSSDTVDNIISTLSDNTSATPTIDNAYESYNLYTGSLGASESKTYHLKIWVDYDATVEQAANKVYSSKINVIANPETTIVDTLEAQFSLNEKTMTGTLSSNVTSATYCTSTDNICEPTTSANISGGQYTVELQGNENKQMVCTRLNGTSKIICSNPVEIKLTTLVDAIKEAYQNSTTTLAYDETVDNNLRYIGADPNNYVLFNDELWRIIGIFDENTHGVAGTELVKIIRDESIGNYSWDNKPSGTGSSTSSYGSNDWSDSALQVVLNEGTYYNRTSGTCPSGRNGATTNCDFSNTGLTNNAKSMIETVTWKLGGSSTYDDVTASMFYERERGTTVYSGHATEWVGEVGLMYPSDYGYATSGGNTANREACLAKKLYNWNSSSFSDCKNNDWLFDSSSYQWTLTPRSSYSDSVFYVYYNGNLLNSSATNGIGARPSVYLKSNIVISGGDGSESNPYRLQMS